jgi:hypothetical protein
VLSPVPPLNLRCGRIFGSASVPSCAASGKAAHGLPGSEAAAASASAAVSICPGAPEPRVHSKFRRRAPATPPGLRVRTGRFEGHAATRSIPQRPPRRSDRSLPAPTMAMQPALPSWRRSRASSSICSPSHGCRRCQAAAVRPAARELCGASLHRDRHPCLDVLNEPLAIEHPESADSSPSIRGG